MLVRILNTMRTMRGKAVADSDWQALLHTEHRSAAAKSAGTASEQDSSAEKSAATTAWYHTCYVWSVVAMASFMQARQSARQAKRTLVYIEAVVGYSHESTRG